jgi:hypothetical protein
LLRVVRTANKLVSPRGTKKSALIEWLEKQISEKQEQPLAKIAQQTGSTRNRNDR